MKRRNLKIFVPVGLVLLGALYACKKAYLDRPPLGTLSQDVLANKVGVDGLLIGAYSLVDGEGGNSSGQGSAASNWTYGGVGADDAYKGSDPSDGGADIFPIESKTITSTNTYVQSKWNCYYDAVQRCNDVLRTIPLAEDITPEDAKLFTAQARFLRGHFLFDLKRIFGNIPFIDESVTAEFSGGGVVVGEFASNATDIWPKIEEDFRYAADNLPDSMSEVGRANKWAALTYLAKTYLYQDKFAEAKPLFDDVINNGKTSDGKKYGLLPNYFSNFNPAQKNSQESVFAAQTSVHDNSSTAWNGQPNGNAGDILNFPYNGGPGQCCGFYNPSMDLGDAYKTDAAGLPLFDTYFDGPTTNDTILYTAGTVDPRIDWSIGRPGVPYLDWGLHPGDSWIRNVGADGHFSPKKSVYAASQKDQYTDVGSAFWAPTQLVANNVNIIRFADVLLMAAECEVEVGSTLKAMEYVNLIRARAQNPNGWVYKNSDYNADQAEYVTKTTPAANYNIGLYTAAQFGTQDLARTAVQFERRLELAMEGHRFFDMQRWDNGTGLMANTLNAMYLRDGELVSYKKTTKFVKGVHELYPIPQSQIDLINSGGTQHLKQNPGY